MFVRDFIHVDRPFEAVAPRFVSDTSWLSPIAEEAALVAAGDVAVDLTHEAGDDGEAHPVGVVRCEVGPVRARARSILVPMWLISVEGRGLLPDLSGDLEVSPVGSERSVIALGATYRRTDRQRDEALLIERATEAGVRRFLAGIAGFLSRPLSTV